MKKWLKYILIGLFMVIGVDNVGAKELSKTCAYDFVGGTIICTVKDNAVTCGLEWGMSTEYGMTEYNTLNYDNFSEKCADYIYVEQVHQQQWHYDTQMYTNHYFISVSDDEIDSDNPLFAEPDLGDFVEFFDGINYYYNYYEAKYNKDKSTSQQIIGGEGTDDENPDDGDYVDGCEDLAETGKLIRQIYNLLKYVVPVVVIGLSVVEFLKVVLNGEEKVFKEAWSKFVKRIIIGVIILILPAILSFVINLSGVLDNYGIDKNNIFCIFR